MNNFQKNSFNYQSNFSKIVEVFIYHNYYIDSVCNTLEFLPELETKIKLRNYELLCKPTSQGFVILQNLNGKTSSPSFSGTINLDFKVIFKDLLFLNLTDIPYENNLSFDFSNKLSPKESLHKNIYVDGNDLTDNNSNGISGRIKLLLNQDNEFFGEEKENRTFFKYSISFNSRIFILRYNFYFVSQSKDMSDYYVFDEKKGKRYLDFKKRKLENGTSVFTLEIPEQKKQSERYDFLYYLKKEDEFDKSFSKFLQYPDPKNLSYDKNEDRFINDLFISLD